MSHKPKKVGDRVYLKDGRIGIIIAKRYIPEVQRTITFSTSMSYSFLKFARDFYKITIV